MYLIDAICLVAAAWACGPVLLPAVSARRRAAAAAQTIACVLFVLVVFKQPEAVEYRPEPFHRDIASVLVVGLFVAAALLRADRTRPTPEPEP